MQVILTEKVPTLGNVGEIVNVRPGHARNFLIPGGKAIIADRGNMAQLKHVEKMLARKVATEKSAAEAVKEQLDGLAIELTRKAGVSGKLFGAVTTNELSKELAKREIEVERRLLSCDRPIKSLGTYQVKVKLFAKEVEALFTVKIERDPQQAEELKKQAKLRREEKEREKKKEAAAAEVSPDVEAGEVPDGESAAVAEGGEEVLADGSLPEDS